jgi:hypothetical protein
MGQEVSKLIDECRRLEREIIKLLRIESLPLSMEIKKFPKEKLIEEAKELSKSSGVENKRRQAENRYEEALSNIAEILEEEGIDQIETQLTKTQFDWLKINKRKIEDRLKMIRI